MRTLKYIFLCLFFLSATIAFLGALEFDFLNISSFIRNYYFAGSLFIVSIGFYFFYFKARIPEISSANKSGFRFNHLSWLSKFSITFIILGGVFLRLWNLGKLGITWDEEINWIMSKSIINNFIPIAPADIMYGGLYFREIFYYYLTSFSALLFGFSEFSMRIISVIAFCILFYYSIKILKLLKVEKIMILAFLFFISFHYWFIVMSRLGRFYMFTITMAVVSLYYFLNYLDSKRKSDAVAFSITSLLALGSGYPGSIVISYIPIYFLARYARDFKSLFSKKFFREEAFKLVFISIYFLLFFLVFFLSDKLPFNLIKIFNFNFYKRAMFFLPLNQTLLKYFIYFMPFLFLCPFLFFNKKINIKEKIIFGEGVMILFLILAYSNKLPDQDGRFFFVGAPFFLLATFSLLKYFSLGVRVFIATFFSLIALLSAGYLAPFFDYGKEVNREYMSARALEYYMDTKTPVIALENIIDEKDIVIFLGGIKRSYPYVKNIKLSQIYQPLNLPNRLKKDESSIILYSNEEVAEVIKNSKGQVFVVLTFPYASPRWYITDWLNDYEQVVLYESGDREAKLLRIIK